MANFLIVEARFYDHLNDMLIEAPKALACKAAGHEHEIVTVPGALEIPGAISMAIDSGQYDGFVAIWRRDPRRDLSFRDCPPVKAHAGIMALTMDGCRYW